MTKVIVKRNHRVSPRVNRSAVGDRMFYGSPSIGESAIVHTAKSLRVFRLALNHRSYRVPPPTWRQSKPNGWTHYFVVEQLLPAPDLDYYICFDSGSYRLYMDARSAIRAGAFDAPKARLKLIDQRLTAMIKRLDKAGLAPKGAKPERSNVHAVEYAAPDRQVVALSLFIDREVWVIEPTTGEEVRRVQRVEEFWVTIAYDLSLSRETPEDLDKLNRKYTGGKGSVMHTYVSKYPATVLEPIEGCIRCTSIDDAIQTARRWANEIELDVQEPSWAYERNEIPTDFSLEAKRDPAQ